MALTIWNQSHSVTFHPMQVNTPRLNPSQRPIILDLPAPKGWKAELTWCAQQVAIEEQLQLMQRACIMVFYQIAGVTSDDDCFRPSRRLSVAIGDWRPFVESAAPT